MSTKTLFDDKEMFQKERPNKITLRQEEGFFLEKANEIIERGWSENASQREIANDLKNVEFPLSDGFERAKELDEKGYYNIDGEFVEWLDMLESGKFEIQKENVKEWVKAHNIKLQHSKGDKFLVKGDNFKKFKKGDVIYIVDLIEETAEYLVRSEDTKKNVIGTYVSYEDLEKNSEKQ